MAETKVASEHSSRSVNLHRLIGVGCGHSIGWEEEDLSEILQHQLNTRLVCDLGLEIKRAQDKHPHGVASRSVGAMTFAGLFADPHPPLTVLGLVKDFANKADHEKAVLPPKVASAVYYASIAAALARHGKRISSLADAELVKGLTWMDEQLWIDVSLRHLARQALTALNRLHV